MLNLEGPTHLTVGIKMNACRPRVCTEPRPPREFLFATLVTLTRIQFTVISFTQRRRGLRTTCDVNVGFTVCTVVHSLRVRTQSRRPEERGNP